MAAEAAAAAIYERCVRPEAEATKIYEVYEASYKAAYADAAAAAAAAAHAACAAARALHAQQRKEREREERERGEGERDGELERKGAAGVESLVARHAITFSVYS